MQNFYMNQRINDFLETEKKCNRELLAQLTLYIFSLESKEQKHDLYLLAKKLPMEQLIDIISYFDGDTLKLPTKEQFFKSYIISIAFYMKTVLELDWTQIKEILNLPSNESDRLSSISIGRKINDIKEKFSKDIYKIFNSIDLDVEGIKATKKEIDKVLNKKTKKEVKDGLFNRKNK